MTPEEASKSNEPVAGNLQDYKDLAKSMNQQVCPQCGYCPTCGRPRNNFNYPVYTTYPYSPPFYQVYCGGGTSINPNQQSIPTN